MKEFLKLIKQAICKANYSKEVINDLNITLDTLTDSYILIHWPDVQDYMEDTWFDEEAISHDENSYFIPVQRIIK